MKRVYIGLLAFCVLCSGCSSMLEREYLAVTPQDPQLMVEEDPAILRAEEYDDIVNAMTYFVENYEETATVRLYNYPSDAVESDLRAARRQVEEDIPLGAYAVEYITTDVVSVVSYVEVTVYITYRRTAEQIKAIRTVIGSAAIRKALGGALGDYPAEFVLQVGRYDQDVELIQGLVEQVHMDNPAWAMGLPETEVYFYPEDGDSYQPVMELLFTYPREVAEMKQMAAELAAWCEETDFSVLETEELAREWYAARVRTGSEGADTAWHALVKGAADETGQELGWRLVCQLAGLEEISSWYNAADTMSEELEHPSKEI